MKRAATRASRPWRRRSERSGAGPGHAEKAGPIRREKPLFRPHRADTCHTPARLADPTAETPRLQQVSASRGRSAQVTHAKSGRWAGACQHHVPIPTGPPAYVGPVVECCGALPSSPTGGGPDATPKEAAFRPTARSNASTRTASLNHADARTDWPQWAHPGHRGCAACGHTTAFEGPKPSSGYNGRRDARGRLLCGAGQRVKAARRPNSAPSLATKPCKRALCRCCSQL